MFDIKFMNTKEGYDIAIENGDIAFVDTFETAIITSLFSDARADSSQIAIPENRRGWIGDVASPIEGDTYGSLLWLIQQARLTQGTVNKAVDYARNSLQWLIDQNAATAINVSGYVSFGTININIDITSLTGNVESHYVALWENTSNAN